MVIFEKSLKSGFSMPVYGLGTWEMGGRSDPDSTNDEADIQAIRNAIDQGITHIDTAESYGDGHTEELVGEAIKDYDRKMLLLTSKVSAWNQSYEDLLRSFENSVKRLKTNYLDLYLLHRYPENGINISDTMRAMDYLVRSGKVKNIGVCNMTVEMLEEVQKHTKNKIVCNQLHYSLECREIVDKGILDFCQANDILVTAWGPLSKGNLDLAAVLTNISHKYGKTPYQVALSWLISQDNVVVIPKTSNVAHLKQNLGSLDWTLDDEDISELTINYPNQIIVSDRVPLNYRKDLSI